MVRAEWDERITELRTGLNFEAEFTAVGDTWSEVDAQGRTVERRTGGGIPPVTGLSVSVSVSVSVRPALDARGVRRASAGERRRIRNRGIGANWLQVLAHTLEPRLADPVGRSRGT